MEKISKELKKRVLQSMSKTQRKKFKRKENTCTFKVTINRLGLKQLYRWGNHAQIIINNKDEIIENTLIENVWEYTKTPEKDAQIALNYLIYGDKTDYKIVVESL